MTDTVFIMALAAYLGLATALVYRSPSHGWGFPIFVLLYPLFLMATFIADSRIVILVWLGLSLVNMAVQFIDMKRQQVSTHSAGVMFASLFLWPVQFAAAISSYQSGKLSEESMDAGKKSIGPLPATITGTVSYTHHIGTDEGLDAVLLEEFGDLSFLIDSKQFDRIGIAEGKILSLTIDEVVAPSDIASGKVLRIIDGKPVTPHVEASCDQPTISNRRANP